ncbi:MAG: DNA mismatch repair protein MutS, partial [Chlamydiales bacterium]
MMQQWHSCKKISKDAVLLFRMGDFYEAFYDDAQIIAKAIDLTLTKRQGTPMCGIPHHTVDSYVDKLVSKGFRVAIAEQMEDPRQAKGIVKRDVVRVVTPGTVVNSSLLTDKTNNFFAAIDQLGSLYGLSFLDISTGEFRVIELNNKRDLLNETYRLRPTEFLTSEKFRDKNSELFEEIRHSYSFLHNTQEEWNFDHQTSYNFLTKHFEVHSLDGYGIKGMLPGINAAGALLAYLKDDLRLPIEHIRDIKTYATSEYMSLDRTTQRNLELTESLSDGSKKNTLLEVLDHTLTPMGGRMLRHWVKQPLLSIKIIQNRQDAIESFVSSPHVSNFLGETLNKVRDIERLIMKVSAGYATPKDLVSLRTSLEQVPGIKTTLESCSAKLVQEACSLMEDPSNVASLIATALVDDPPVRVSDGNMFRSGYHEELDELKEISRNGKTWIAKYQAQLREETGIKTLRVGYTRVFGYYIEVSKAQAPNMPESFVRRQTLVNCERFISPELKNYESKVLTAEDKSSSLETSLFNDLRQEVAKSAKPILAIAQAIASIDSLYSLAETARKNHYIRPTVNTSSELNIIDGRHPVIEVSALNKTFIPNDTVMGDNDNSLFIITGPNMAGKSTYIRQVALLTIMAQMGSFVPAKTATIGIVDKVFTRIGASDDLNRGQSTFMVEMTETANILNNATSRSLVILDEIGRGTSTYDGISIAWSVAEYLLTVENKKAKTLFATHYWELTKMEEKIPGAVNYNVMVRETDDGIVFLHKILKGETDKSYGVHVARLAGLPQEVVDRSKEILVHLEENSNRKESFEAPKTKKVLATRIKNNDSEIQLILFEPSTRKKQEPKHTSQLLDELKALDLDTITPIQAHRKLMELKALLSK